jgi:hydrogenase maturation protease
MVQRRRAKNAPFFMGIYDQGVCMNQEQQKNITILVLGIGNTVMCDDGVGVKVVQRLVKEYRLPPYVDVMDGGTLGLDILPRLEGIQKLIVVDALETGKSPGTCIRLVGEEIPIALETKVSPHQMGLKDLLAVSHLMEGQLPAEMVLIGIQPECIELDTELTSTVAAQLDNLLNHVVEELEGWGVEVRAVD